MWSNDEMKSSVSQHISDIAIQYVHQYKLLKLLTLERGNCEQFLESIV